MLGRYSSAIRAACANERSCGSVRGAISNGRPYRDLKIPNQVRQNEVRQVEFKLLHLSSLEYGGRESERS